MTESLKKILLIEDEELFSKSLSIALIENDYSVEVATDGAEGIEKAKEVVPDLILLDNILPKVQGLDVLGELKSDEKTKNIPILMLTVLSDSETISKALGMGAIGYLIKSDYQLHEIINKVKKILNPS